MTTPSQVPVPSELPQDLKFNAGKVDEFVTSFVNQYIDRFGAAHLTIEGITALAMSVIEQIKADGEEAVSSIGWQELGDWATGLNITNRNQIVYYAGSWYKYLGTLPHTIAGASPAADGGIWSPGNPTGAWANIGDAALRSELASSDPALGASLIALSGTTVYKSLVGRRKILFQYLSDAKIASVLAGTSVDVTTELQAAMNDNITIEIPDGFYYVTSSITASVSSGLVGNGPRHCSIDNRSADHLFKFGAGYNRGWKPWSGFKVGSSTASAADKYAFYFTGSTTAGVLDYAASQHFSLIEIDGTGMGGGWYLQDCFRVTVRDCGASGLANPFYLRGSVVQLLADNFVNNGDSAPTFTNGSFGVQMVTKTYTDGNGTKTPEGIVFSNCRFVRQAVGANALGLYISFVNTEFDYCWQAGGVYAGGSQLLFSNCYVGVQTNRPNNFIGFDIPAQASGVPEKVVVENCTVNMQVNTNANAASYYSYGVRVSSSTVAQVGASVNKNTFRGSGFTYGIYVYRGVGLSINENAFQYAGINIKVEECKSLIMMSNTDRNGTGTYEMTSVDNAASWILLNNTGVFSTLTMSNYARSLIINPNKTPFYQRTSVSLGSAVNTSVAAGASYHHSVALNSDVPCGFYLGGLNVRGFTWGIARESNSNVVVTLSNVTGAAISLNTTLYVYVTYPAVG